MNYFSKNLRVLIWKCKGELSRQTYAEYIDHIATQCHLLPDSFKRIIKGEVVPDSMEVNAIREFFSDWGYDLSAMEYVDLFDDIVEKSKNEIEIRNISYLINSLEQGETIKFVEKLGVNPSTVTRWKKGITHPDKDSREKICDYFGITNYRLLQYQFLFLGLEPVSTRQKKKAIIELIEKMDKADFEMIYPALNRMMR